MCVRFRFCSIRSKICREPSGLSIERSNSTAPCVFWRSSVRTSCSLSSRPPWNMSMYTFGSSVAWAKKCAGRPMPTTGKPTRSPTSISTTDSVSGSPTRRRIT